MACSRRLSDEKARGGHDTEASMSAIVDAAFRNMKEPGPSYVLTLEVLSKSDTSRKLRTWKRTSFGRASREIEELVGVADAMTGDDATRGSVPEDIGIGKR